MRAKHYLNSKDRDLKMVKLLNITYLVLFVLIIGVFIFKEIYENTTFIKY